MHQTTPHPLLLSTTDLAKFFGQARDTVTEMVRDAAWVTDDLPRPLWIGPDSHLGAPLGHVRFARDEVVRWLDERSVAAGYPPPAAEDQDAPLTLHPTTEVAGLLSVSYDTFKKWAAARIWEADDLPAPIWIGRGSGTDLQTAKGRRSGQRRWRSTDLRQWIAARSTRADWMVA